MASNRHRRNRRRHNRDNPSPNPTGNYGPESIMDVIRNNEEDDTSYSESDDIDDLDDIDPSIATDLLDQIATSQDNSESESDNIDDTNESQQSDNETDSDIDINELLDSLDRIENQQPSADPDADLDDLLNLNANTQQPDPVSRASSSDSDILSKQNIDAKEFVSYLENIGDAEDAYDLFNYITQTVMASDEKSPIRQQYNNIMKSMSLEERKQLHDIKIKAEAAKRNREQVVSSEDAKGKGKGKGYDHWDTNTYYDMYGNMHLGARGPNGENNLDKRVMYEDVLSPVLSEFAHTTGKTVGDSLSLEGAKYDNYRSILGNAMGAMSDSYKQQAAGISENRNRAADPRDYMNALSRQTDIASAALQANALEKATSKKKGAAAAYNIGQGIDNALRTTTANMRARDDAARQAQLMMNEHPNNGFYEDNISQRKRRDMASRPRSDK